MESDLAEIALVQSVVEKLEAKLGNSHPQVGKAWLALARMYQHVGTANSSAAGMDSAARALARAWSVCHCCASSMCYSLKCDEAFKYLQGHLTSAGEREPGKQDV